MAPTRKTWQEKLADSKDLPKVVKISAEQKKRWGGGTSPGRGGGTLVVPAPVEVDAVMKQVRKGRLTTINDIRNVLAEQHGTSMTCPITTGIFAWISANAAEEAAAEDKKRITPYWRTLKAKGELNPKYPGGIKAVKEKLEAEGHVVVQVRKRFFVEAYEKKLARLKVGAS